MMRIVSGIAILLLLVSLTSLEAASYFTDRGSVQIGGGFEFYSYGNEARDDRDNEFHLYPLVNFFPLAHFLVGPVFNLSVYENSAGFSAGARAGFAYGRNIPVIPFVWGSPQLLVGGNRNNANAGYGTEIAGGIMVPIKDHFSINFGPHFWFEVFRGFWSNHFAMGVSVTGLIF